MPATTLGSSYRRGRGNRASRATLIVAILLVHLVAIALIGLQRATAIPKPPTSMTLIAVNEGEPPKPAPLAKPARSHAPPTSSLIDRNAILPPASGGGISAAVDEAGASSGASSSCALASEASAAILSSAPAMSELDALPAGVRSPADAVMLWNGQWLDPGPLTPNIAAGSMRRIVENIVAAAPANCRDQKQVGPQFLPIPETARTTMLVVGSGNWSWAELIEPSGECTVDSVTPCVPAAATPPTATN